MNEKSTLRKVAKDYLTHTKKEKGITLIALVVTIVVLLILAGVSTNVLFSDSGLIEKAQDSGLKIRAAQVEEVVANWKQSNFINSSINKQKETADKMLEDLLDKKLVTEDEIDKEQEKIIIKKKDGTIVKEISYSDVEIVISKTPEKEKSGTVNLKVESVKGMTQNIITEEELINHVKSLSDERKKEMLKEQMVPFINKEDPTANCQTFEDVLKWMKNEEIIAEETENAFWNWTQSVNKVEGLTNVEAILGEQLEFLYLDKSTGEIIGYSVINPDEQISGTYIATENGTYTFKIQDLITGKTYYKKVEVTNVDANMPAYEAKSIDPENGRGTYAFLYNLRLEQDTTFQNAYIIYENEKIDVSSLIEERSLENGEKANLIWTSHINRYLYEIGKTDGALSLGRTIQHIILVKDKIEYPANIRFKNPIN